MKVNFRLFLLLIFPVLLGGCFSVPSSPSPKFYTLQPAGNLEAKKFDSDMKLIIGIGPVEIPQYQNRPQIVTRDKEGMLTFAQFERWGEPLDSAIARLLLFNLTTLLPQADFQMFPSNSVIPLDYQVLINIVQLDSRLNQNISLTAQWTVVEGKTKAMLMSRRFQASEPASGNYAGLAKALGKIITNLSDEIAGNLVKLPLRTKIKDIAIQ